MPVALIGALIGLSKAIAEGVPVDKPEEISCRFKGLENLYADGDIIRLEIKEGLQSATLQVGKDHREISVKKRDGEGLEDLKIIIRQNLRGFETGQNGYYTVEDAARFLEIERPYYEDVLDRAYHVTAYKFAKQGKEPDWSFEIEEAYNFYDQEDHYLMSWAYSRFTGVFNFCIPDTK